MALLRSRNNIAVLIIPRESHSLAEYKFEYNPFHDIYISKQICKYLLKVKRIIREPIPFRDEKLHDVIFHRKGR